MSGQYVDHINGNRLDNRKVNLRIATNQQNVFNKKPHGKSKYKGVSFRNQDKKWYAQILFNKNGKKRYIRSKSGTEEECAKYYDCMARIIHEEFAWLNYKY
jgi:hypothetical protein